MTIEEFDRLPDVRQKELLIDAEKISEREDEHAKYTVFQIDDFFVEVSMSVIHRFRKILKTFTLQNQPH